MRKTINNGEVFKKKDFPIYRNYDKFKIADFHFYDILYLKLVVITFPKAMTGYRLYLFQSDNKHEQKMFETYL